MKKYTALILAVCLLFSFAGCSTKKNTLPDASQSSISNSKNSSAEGENSLQPMKSVGIDTEFHKYLGLGHGFGIGTGTIAEGWLDDAVSFWEKQIKEGA